MSIIVKPRQNIQGIVESVSDLASLNGRPTYRTLVKDVGVFEWLSSGTADNSNIYEGASGVWSKVVNSSSVAKVYRALLTQTSSNTPVADVKENSTGLTFTSARGFLGAYSLNFSTPVPVDKIFIPGSTTWDIFQTITKPLTDGAAIVGYITFYCSYLNDNITALNYDTVDNTFTPKEMSEMVSKLPVEFYIYD